MTPADIAVALIRTTLAASAAALAAWALLAWLRIDSPRIHRTAWLLVIAQGWLFVPLTIEIETSSPPSAIKRAAGLVPAGIHEEEAIEFENGSQWGRGPFATGDSPLVTAPPSQKVPDPLPLAIAVWLLGASLIVVIAAYRYMRVLRTLPLGAPPDEPTWQAEWRSALAAAKLRRRQTVDLRITASLGPLLHWAPWSYLILVPRELWSALASPERQAILRHELAHLRRRDLWKSLAIRVLALPQWFNPLVWFAVRRFDEAAEWACDDAAAATNAGRLTFAASLLQSAEYAAAPFPASAPAARGVLTRRIHRLVSPRFKEESKMKLLIVPTLLVIAAVAQTFRIEQVIADEPPAAVAPPSPEEASQHSGPPLNRQKMDFDRLTKEFENVTRTTYVIEPPDIVSIRISHRFSGPEEWSGMLTDVKRPQLKVTEGVDKNTRRYLVDMDGYVRLNALHWVRIAGMTVKEAQAAVKSKYQSHAGEEVDVRLAIAEFNSKVAYLILQDDHGKSHVIRTPLPYPLSSKMDVGALLKSAKYPHPIDFAAARIALRRPAPNGVGSDTTLPVTWDVARGTPTATSNYPLLPGDRVFVSPPQSDGAEAIQRASFPSPEAPPTPPPTPVDESKLQRPNAVEIDLTVIEDSADALAEFHNGAADMIMADAKTFQAALRTFEKNGLVKLSSQRLQCKFGKSTSTSVMAPIPNPLQRKPFRTADASEVLVKSLGDDVYSVKLQFKQKVDDNDVRESIDICMRSGETNVLECTGIAADESQPKTKTYLAVTVAPPVATRGGASYRLQPHDTLKLRVIRPDRPAYTLTWGDFEGEFTVNQDGEVKLGRATGGGAVSVAGLTANEARDAIEQHLRKESSAECELQLAISQLAAEKYVISIQRADGTELAVGALRPDYLSKSDFLEWPLFRSFIAELTPIREVKLERADRHRKTESIKLTTIWDAIQAPQMPACDHPVRPGDRLVVTVADDWQPRVFPSWLEPRDVQRKRGQTLFRIGEGWSQVGGVKFDHPDVQRPAGPKYSR